MEQTESIQVNCSKCGVEIVVPIADLKPITTATCICGFVVEFDASDLFAKTGPEHLESLACDVDKDMESTTIKIKF